MLSEVPTSGLVVLVPEAEPVVGHLRDRWDANAGDGVAAHVTVLFPFVPPAAVDDTVLRRLRDLFASVPAFPYAFARTAWFDDRVLWLAPDDDRPFRELTALVHRAFPAYPPFGGVYADPVPHLTVGHEAPVEELRAAEAELVGFPPVHGRARSVTLLAQPDPARPVEVRAEFPLG